MLSCAVVTLVGIILLCIPAINRWELRDGSDSFVDSEDIFSLRGTKPIACQIVRDSAIAAISMAIPILINTFSDTINSKPSRPLNIFLFVGLLVSNIIYFCLDIRSYRQILIQIHVRLILCVGFSFMQLRSFGGGIYSPRHFILLSMSSTGAVLCSCFLLFHTSETTKCILLACFFSIITLILWFVYSWLQKVSKLHVTDTTYDEKNCNAFVIGIGIILVSLALLMLLYGPVLGNPQSPTYLAFITNISTIFMVFVWSCNSQIIRLELSQLKVSIYNLLHNPIC